MPLCEMGDAVASERLEKGTEGRIVGSWMAAFAVRVCLVIVAVRMRVVFE
jgi:hypothetical protein